MRTLEDSLSLCTKLKFKYIEIGLLKTNKMGERDILSDDKGTYPLRIALH